MPSLNPQLWSGLVPGRGQGRLSPCCLHPSTPVGSGRTQCDLLCPQIQPKIALSGAEGAFFVPTLAKAHPDPKLSRVRVSQVAAGTRGAGGAEQSHPSAQGLGSAFCCSSGEADARPGPAAPLGMASAGSGSRPCAVLVRARRRGEQGAGGRQQDQGSTSVSALLMPVSLCFFDKNLAQDDPHWGVGLDGQPDGLQWPKRWVHLTLCNTFGERAYLDVAVRCPAVFDDCTSSLLQGFLI